MYSSIMDLQHPMQGPLLCPIIQHLPTYDDKGTWEMPNVYTETYMKSNWSKTEFFKIKARKFLYSMTEVANSWRLNLLGCDAVSMDK
jgi:hypothetical protein